jgi:hypothetical protein
VTSLTELESEYRWRSRPGAAPSPRQARVLYACARAEADNPTAYGPTAIELAVSCWNVANVDLTRAQVRDAARELIAKGYVYKLDRRRHGGDVTYQVSDSGHVRLLNWLRPDLSNGRIFHQHAMAELGDPRDWVPEYFR